MGILPILIRTGRKKYVKWLAHRSSVHPTMEGLSESSRLLDSQHENTSSDEDPDDPKAATHVAGSERFDIYFGGLSFIIDAIAFSAIGSSRTKLQLYLCKPGEPSVVGPLLRSLIQNSNSTFEYFCCRWTERSGCGNASHPKIDERPSPRRYVTHRRSRCHTFSLGIGKYILGIHGLFAIPCLVCRGGKSRFVSTPRDLKLTLSVMIVGPAFTVCLAYASIS